MKKLLKLYINFLIWRAEIKAKRTKYKYLVIRIGKKIQIVRRAHLKLLVKQKLFRKGVTIRDIEKNAIYTTINHIKS